MYEMFVGDFEKAAPWSTQSIKGCRRFLERVCALESEVKEGDQYSPENESLMHKTIKKVSEDIETLKFNTAIAALMTLLNQFAEKGVNRAEFKTFITLLNPFAPHLTEELNEQMGGTEMLVRAPWPQYDESKTQDQSIDIAVQINGKVKSIVTISADADEQAMLDIARADEKVAAALSGMQVVKTIVVKGKIINIVVKPL